MAKDALLGWLLDSDPALQWRVSRDLLHEPGAKWQTIRDRTATEGFGAALLARQDVDGQWAGGAHFPGGWFDSENGPHEEGQPWTATGWSLKDLREWGVPASALGDTADRLERNCRWEYEDLPFWDGEVDVCINAYTLSNGAWLGRDMSALAAWFPAHQLDDGGWNCEWVEGSTRSSFHSTLNAVIALLDYEKRTGDTPLREVRHRGEEYLLERGLFRRKRDGEPFWPHATRFFYPFRWPASVLKSLDYFVDSSAHDDTAPDPRLGETVEIVRAGRGTDGRWIREAAMPGATWFDIDAPVGEPSKWLTYHAMRVLNWWDAAGRATPAHATNGSSQ